MLGRRFGYLRIFWSIPSLRLPKEMSLTNFSYSWILWMDSLSGTTCLFVWYCTKSANYRNSKWNSKWRTVTRKYIIALERNEIDKFQRLPHILAMPDSLEMVPSMSDFGQQLDDSVITTFTKWRWFIGRNCNYFWLAADVEQRRRSHTIKGAYLKLWKRA